MTSQLKSSDPWWAQRWPVAAYRRWTAETPKALRLFDVLTYLAPFVPMTMAGIIWRAAATAGTVKNEPWQFLGAFVGAACVIGGILGKRKKDWLERKQSKGYEEGINRAYEQWRDSADILQGAMAMTYRFVEVYKADESREAGEGAIGQYLTAIALTVREIFGENAGKILVSISIPTDDGKGLRTAKFHMESPGRHAGRGSLSLSAPRKGPKNFGAVKAFREGAVEYVPNTEIRQLAPIFRDRDYKSFMSWPVKCGRGEKVLGVVSIDSAVAEGFDPPAKGTRRQQVWWMSQPALTGIALCLLDRKTFERYRTNTGTTSAGDQEE